MRTGGFSIKLAQIRIAVSVKFVPKMEYLCHLTVKRLTFLRLSQSTNTVVASTIEKYQGSVNLIVA